MNFNKIKSMHFPSDVYIGHDAILNIGSVVSKFLKSGDVLLITGENTYNIAGKKVLSNLNDFDVNVIIASRATRDSIKSIEESLKNRRSGIVLGVGGGSKIDIAKKIAYDLGIPFISVPTTPSHDGIASPRASIYDGKSVYSEEATMPSAIVADTSIMVLAPYRYVAAGAADVISNITAVLDWKLANRLKGEEFSSTAAVMSEYAGRELIERSSMIQPGLEESIWLVTKQILASGAAMAIAGSSRPASGSEHLFSHAIEILGPGSSIHGEQCAMGSLISMYLHGGDWELLKNTYRKIGLNTRAESYGIGREIAIKALSIAHRIRPSRYTILGESDLSYNVAERILSITGII
ncbi:NAD(P)-dependent glycerol-1-phosphate dehydrogenase [Picrophilus oshimae]|uniref:Glycerol-1-phosphate dehydrogenase [NAD(P)+] n=1 Tax=Picrophilus torridus (strain ATCC 700027 / DSM 9790 / JCM 10055 / NBRC 100828 / KAW 2/3) TaxID=1122961 RepID=A0A8G2L7F1_PICTO|nr:NAD(P)-dependent glycerol-1-phosphate dehydrogenase [Picrophilus oshimae]SMD30255.1 glycerol-1-phosphate dehydrogenase [NAD(P)+] [Picrophilus oshimae DSM 9789]